MLKTGHKVVKHNINMKLFRIKGETMSWQYYINMEPMALEIADEHIKKMTDNNLDKREPCFLNEKYFIPNLKNGFVAATMLVAYCESFINSLIRLEYRDLAKDLYARSTKFKLDRLYDDKGKSDRLKELSDSAAFKHYSTFDTVRNELIHYQVSTKEHASRLADFKIKIVNASRFFTKENFTHGKENTVELAKVIADDLGYGIKEDMSIVSCDGNHPIFYNYVYKLEWLDQD